MRADSFEYSHVIRTIPDYPKPGIMFRDVTTLFGHEVGFRAAVNALSAPFLNAGISKVAGIEARGFILGGAVAVELGVGFIPVRKKGKLPYDTVGLDYALEYGTDRIEIHKDAVEEGERVLVIDDLIATGGTAAAAVALLRSCGAVINSAAFVVDLPDLGGRRKLISMDIESHALCAFDGD